MSAASEVVVPDVDTSDELNVASWYKDSGDVEVEPIDTSRMQFEELARILSSETLEDILKQTTVMAASDLDGETVQVLGYTRLPSTKADSALRFYLMIDIVTGDGEFVKVTCGAMKVMARIMSLRAHGHLPCLGAFVVASRPTSSGNYPIDFEGRSKESMKAGGGAKGSDF